MSKRYRLGRRTRLVNTVFSALTRLGLGARYRQILTVRGRSSGLPRSTPVDVMTLDGQRYLVAGYGEVNWVRNLRSAKRLTLSRGGKSATFTAEEVDPEAAVPVVRAYLHQVPVTRAYWDVTEDAPTADIAADTAHHPVFRLTAVG